MTPERWVQIKDIFANVVELPLDARHTAVAELCQGDTELEVEVGRLLSQHDEMGGFLEGSSPAESKASGEMLAAGEILAGRYRILESLGSGGMGEVYAAEDQDLGEQIAIKVIRPQTPFGPDLLDRLRREVQLARRVTHPNVCRVFDLGHHQQENREFVFLTMELIRGETLSTRLKREGKIAPTEALLIAEQLCQALDAAHRAGILHRDFKCSNVMLIGSGADVRAVITDFGIARLIRPPAESTGLTTAHGMVLGTPAYMSPEQLLGEELTIASDIYSLGLVLYEMVTGNRPFRDESSWTETLKRLTYVPPAPIKVAPELNQRWNSTILRCLARDPAKRFSSAREVALSLNRRRGASPLLFQPVVLAAACTLLMAAGILFFLRDRIWPPQLPRQKHIAVLPFAFVGTDTVNQATAYELSESLTRNLSRLQASENSLWVVPWQEAKGQKPEDATHAASALGVNLLVMGELQKDAAGLHLRMQLKDARSLRQLRAQTFEIAAPQVVTLEDKLLEQAATMLELHLPQDTLRNLHVGVTAEPGAYEFYEQGRGYLVHLSAGTPEDADRAIALLQKAIEKDPNFALAYANLAFAYASKFRRTHDLALLEKAKETCNRALALNDKLAAAHLTQALIQQETGDLDGAIREFEQALQLDPTSDETVTNLSLAYDKAGRLLQAEALLKNALQRSPGRWINYDYLGYFYYEHADYAQAEPLFRTATELAPDNPLAFYNLGGVYMAEGKYKDAEDILTKGIAIRPTAGGYSNLALARQYQGRYEDAAAMFQKAVELSPADHRYWCNLGLAYTLAKNRPKATEAFQTALQLAQKAVDLRPSDPSVLGTLARYHAELGQKTKAQEEIALATASPHNDPELLFNSVVVYELVGERDRALTALRSALRAGYSLSEVQHAPELLELRQDPRYSRMVSNQGS